VGEKIDDFEGMAAEEVEEVLQDKHAKANAQILEIVSAALCIYKVIQRVSTDWRSA
jgi:predicted house-cleaning noncanonical NTP pyrophosphatase (MazG superfamily)